MRKIKHIKVSKRQNTYQKIIGLKIKLNIKKVKTKFIKK